MNRYIIRTKITTIKRQWGRIWRGVFLEFYIAIPFIRIQTIMFKQACERYTYDICRLRIEIIKWKFEFQLYRKPIL